MFSCCRDCGLVFFLFCCRYDYDVGLFERCLELVGNIRFWLLGVYCIKEYEKFIGFGF